MRTFFKYLIYIALIIIAYFVIQGVWEDKITENSTVKEVVNQVGTGMDNAMQKATQNKME